MEFAASKHILIIDASAYKLVAGTYVEFVSKSMSSEWNVKIRTSLPPPRLHLENEEPLGSHLSVSMRSGKLILGDKEHQVRLLRFKKA